MNYDAQQYVFNHGLAAASQLHLQQQHHIFQQQQQYSAAAPSSSVYQPRVTGQHVLQHKDIQAVTLAHGGLPQGYISQSFAKPAVPAAVDGSSRLYVASSQNGMIYSQPQRHVSSRLTQQSDTTVTGRQQAQGVQQQRRQSLPPSVGVVGQGVVCDKGNCSGWLQSQHMQAVGSEHSATGCQSTLPSFSHVWSQFIHHKQLDDDSLQQCKQIHQYHTSQQLQHLFQQQHRHAQTQQQQHHHHHQQQEQHMQQQLQQQHHQQHQQEQHKQPQQQLQQQHQHKQHQQQEQHKQPQHDQQLHHHHVQTQHQVRHQQQQHKQSQHQQVQQCIQIQQQVQQCVQTQHQQQVRDQPQFTPDSQFRTTLPGIYEVKMQCQQNSEQIHTPGQALPQSPQTLSQSRQMLSQSRQMLSQSRKMLSQSPQILSQPPQTLSQLPQQLGSVPASQVCAEFSVSEQIPRTERGKRGKNFVDRDLTLTAAVLPSPSSSHPTTVSRELQQTCTSVKYTTSDPPKFTVTLDSLMPSHTFALSHLPDSLTAGDCARSHLASMILGNCHPQSQEEWRVPQLQVGLRPKSLLPTMSVDSCSSESCCNLSSPAGTLTPPSSVDLMFSPAGTLTPPSSNDLMFSPEHPHFLTTASDSSLSSGRTSRLSSSSSMSSSSSSSSSSSPLPTSTLLWTGSQASDTVIPTVTSASSVASSTCTTATVVFSCSTAALITTSITTTTPNPAERTQIAPGQSRTFLGTTSAGPWDTPSHHLSPLVGTGEKSAKQIQVPYSWHRVCQNGIIVYVSPSGTVLQSYEQIYSYLLSDNTCKCGLECPLQVEVYFSFDPEVESQPWLADCGSEDLTNLCSHRRDLLTLAAFHSSFAEVTVSTAADEAVASVKKRERNKSVSTEGLRVAPLKRLKSSITNAVNKHTVSMACSTSTDAYNQPEAFSMSALRTPSLSADGNSTHRILSSSSPPAVEKSAHKISSAVGNSAHRTSPPNIGNSDLCSEYLSQNNPQHGRFRLCMDHREMITLPQQQSCGGQQVPEGNIHQHSVIPAEGSHQRERTEFVSNHYCLATGKQLSKHQVYESPSQLLKHQVHETPSQLPKHPVCESPSQSQLPTHPVCESPSQSQLPTHPVYESPSQSQLLKHQIYESSQSQLPKNQVYVSSQSQLPKHQMYESLSHLPNHQVCESTSQLSTHQVCELPPCHQEIASLAVFHRQDHADLRMFTASPYQPSACYPGVWKDTSLKTSAGMPHPHNTGPFPANIYLQHSHRDRCPPDTVLKHTKSNQPYTRHQSLVDFRKAKPKRLKNKKEKLKFVSSTVDCNPSSSKVWQETTTLPSTCASFFGNPIVFVEQQTAIINSSIASCHLTPSPPPPVLAAADKPPAKASLPGHQLARLGTLKHLGEDEDEKTATDLDSNNSFSDTTENNDSAYLSQTGSDVDKSDTADGLDTCSETKCQLAIDSCYCDSLETCESGQSLQGGTHTEKTPSEMSMSPPDCLLSKRRQCKIQPHANTVSETGILSSPLTEAQSHLTGARSKDRITLTKREVAGQDSEIFQTGMSSCLNGDLSHLLASDNWNIPALQQVLVQYSGGDPSHLQNALSRTLAAPEPNHLQHATISHAALSQKPAAGEPKRLQHTTLSRTLAAPESKHLQHATISQAALSQKLAAGEQKRLQHTALPQMLAADTEFSASNLLSAAARAQQKHQILSCLPCQVSSPGLASTKVENVSMSSFSSCIGDTRAAVTPKPQPMQSSFADLTKSANIVGNLMQLQQLPSGNFAVNLLLPGKGQGQMYPSDSIHARTDAGLKPGLGGVPQTQPGDAPLAVASCLAAQHGSSGKPVLLNSLPPTVVVSAAVPSVPMSVVTRSIAQVVPTAFSISQVVVGTQQNGTQIFATDTTAATGGHIVNTSPQGTQLVTAAGGHIINTSPQGTQLVTDAGGHIINTSPQGTQLVTAAQGRHIINTSPQGTQLVTAAAQGRHIINTSPQGTQLVTAAQGRHIINTSPQGTQLVTAAAQGRQFMGPVATSTHLVGSSSQTSQIANSLSVGNQLVIASPVQQLSPSLPLLSPVIAAQILASQAHQQIPPSLLHNQTSVMSRPDVLAGASLSSLTTVSSSNKLLTDSVPQTGLILNNIGSCQKMLDTADIANRVSHVGDSNSRSVYAASSQQPVFVIPQLGATPVMLNPSSSLATDISQQQLGQPQVQTLLGTGLNPLAAQQMVNAVNLSGVQQQQLQVLQLQQLMLQQIHSHGQNIPAISLPISQTASKPGQTTVAAAQTMMNHIVSQENLPLNPVSQLNLPLNPVIDISSLHSCLPPLTQGYQKLQQSPSAPTVHPVTSVSSSVPAQKLMQTPSLLPQTGHSLQQQHQVLVDVISQSCEKSSAELPAASSHMTVKSSTAVTQQQFTKSYPPPVATNVSLVKPCQPSKAKTRSKAKKSESRKATDTETERNEEDVAATVQQILARAVQQQRELSLAAQNQPPPTPKSKSKKSQSRSRSNQATKEHDLGKLVSISDDVAMLRKDTLTVKDIIQNSPVLKESIHLIQSSHGHIGLSFNPTHSNHSLLLPAGPPTTPHGFLHVNTVPTSPPAEGSFIDQTVGDTNLVTCGSKKSSISLKDHLSFIVSKDRKLPDASSQQYTGSSSSETCQPTATIMGTSCQPTAVASTDMLFQSNI